MSSTTDLHCRMRLWRRIKHVLYHSVAARDFFGAKLIARNFRHGTRTMPTFSLEADEQHIIDSFQNENDRTVGIVGGSILEARLEEKLAIIPLT